VAIQDWQTVDDKPPTASTDAEGRFRFDNLRPSPDPMQQVRLIAHKAGYEPSYTDPLLGTTDYPIKLRSAATSGDNP